MFLLNILLLLFMGRSIFGEDETLNYFPIDQHQTSLQPQPQQIRASPRLSQKETFKGFRFQDNKAKYAWEEGKNGAALINVDSLLPPSMTLCMRGRILYNRHGDINYWFNVLIKRKNPTIFSPTIDFGFYQRSKGEWILEGGAGATFIYIIMNEEEQDKAKEANSWPSRNTLRKWTHACVVGDFTDDKTTLFINGKKINEAEFKFSKSFPENYFSEELRSSGVIMSGFSVEFGRHAFDSAPIIGDLVDINAWDRALDESELEAITNCRSFELRVGNLINKTSAFNVTGPLCQPVEVEKRELSCRETKGILLPVHANSLSNAVKQCDRLLQKSLGPFFRTADKYASLYKRLELLPKTEGFKDLCWFGGRVLVWLPYKKVSGKTTWNHITDSSEAVWDTTIFVGEKPSANIEEEDVCLVWYLGPLANGGGDATPGCAEKLEYDWSPCVTCTVPHTLVKLSKISKY